MVLDNARVPPSAVADAPTIAPCRPEDAHGLRSLYTNNADRVLRTCGPNFLAVCSPLTPTARDVYPVRAGTRAHAYTPRSTMAPGRRRARRAERKEERRESGSPSTRKEERETRPYRGTARTTLRVIAGASRSRRCADAGCAHAAAHDAAATSRDARSHSPTRTHAGAMHAHPHQLALLYTHAR